MKVSIKESIKKSMMISVNVSVNLTMKMLSKNSGSVPRCIGLLLLPFLLLAGLAGSSKHVLALPAGSSTTPLLSSSGLQVSANTASARLLSRGDAHLLLDGVTRNDTTTTPDYLEENQLRSAIKSDIIRFRGLTQIQGVFVTDGDADGTSLIFRETNLRLGIGTAFDSPLNATLQLDFSQEPNFLDAFITYAPSSTLSFKAGAFKFAQNLDVIPNPGAADFLTRGVLVRELLYPRDIGIQASITLPEGLTWHIALVNGDRLSSSPDNKMLLTSRIEKSGLSLWNGSLKTGLFGHIGQAEQTALGQFRQIVVKGKRRLVGVDGRYVSPDWIFAAEMAYSTVETIPGMDKMSRFFGYMATAGYQFNADQQVLARVEYFERSRTAADGHYTIWTAGYKQKLTELFAASVNSTLRFDQDLSFGQFGITTNLQFQF